jgi:hypothetical protein
VLIDSETIAARIHAEALGALGHAYTLRQVRLIHGELRARGYAVGPGEPRNVLRRQPASHPQVGVSIEQSERGNRQLRTVVARSDGTILVLNVRPLMFYLPQAR